MNKESTYKFVLALGIVLLLFGLVNVLAVSLLYQVLMGIIGFLLVALSGYLLAKERPYHKYQYRQKRDSFQTVEYHWGSNVKTVSTYKKGKSFGHSVLPDNASDKHFTVEPYKKEKNGN